MNYPTTYEEALSYESMVAQLVAKNMQNAKLEQTPETRAHIESIERLIPLGRYEHFKSTPEHPMTYRVTGMIDDVNTGHCSVKYMPEYGAYEGRERQRILVGPDSWLRPIDRPGYRGVRFRKLPDEDTHEID